MTESKSLESERAVNTHDLTALADERAELVAANETATSWGAAVGARSGRIKEIDQLLSANSKDDPLKSAARKCADDLVIIVEAATKMASRTGNTFVIDRARVASMIAGHFTALRASAVQGEPDQKPVAWQCADDVPPVSKGQMREYVVAVRRSRTGKVHTFAACYLNAYPLEYRDCCPKGDGCDGNGCDDGCPTTGWFDQTGDDYYDSMFNPLSLEKDDVLMGWREVPQWGEDLSPPPAAGWDEATVHGWRVGRNACADWCRSNGYGDVAKSLFRLPVPKPGCEALRTTPAATKSAKDYHSAWDALENAPHRLPDHGGADAGVKLVRNLQSYLRVLRSSRERKIALEVWKSDIDLIERAIAVLSHQPAPVENTDSDPSTDGRWQDGLDFGMMQLCTVMGVDPTKVTWDAATETVDGDVRAVIWNILRAKMGGDWRPAPVAANASAEARLREALFIFREFVNVNVTQWQLGAGDHHHPMWALISHALGPDRERNRTEAEWRFIQPEQRDSAHPHAGDCDKQGETRCNTRRCYDLGCFGLCGGETTKSEGISLSDLPIGGGHSGIGFGHKTFVRKLVDDPNSASGKSLQDVEVLPSDRPADVTVLGACRPQRGWLMRLTEAHTRELRILEALNEGTEDFGYFGFDTLSRRTQLDRRQVRLDVRRMSRKGWTKFGKGLWSDCGEPAGSGYAITDLGRAALAQSEEKK